MQTRDIRPTKAANVTEAVINGWKKDHPRGVWKVIVYSDDYEEPRTHIFKRIAEKQEEEIAIQEEYDSEIAEYIAANSRTAYFRKPSRVELASAAAIKNDPMGIAEGLLRDSFLGGDEELLNDDDYFQGALDQFQELMQVRRGEIKKL